MSLATLFRGVSVVIDDEIDDTTANINRIVEQLDARGIPLLRFNALPSEAEIEHFHSLSFVLLDWRLDAQQLDEDDSRAGVKVPNLLIADNEERNLAFLRRLKEFCFCPVFIFTNESRDDILSRLIDQGLYIQDQPNHIFVRSKSDVEEKDALFNVIEQWLSENPSVYVLKEWEREYANAKNRLFLDFQKLSVIWPRVVWRTIGEDGGNKSFELGELIARNLQTRMTPFEFNDDLLKSQDDVIDESELRRVLEGERLLTDTTSESKTGDLYVENYKTDAGEQRQKYWLNIRPQCDLLRQSDPELYLLPGKDMTDRQDKLDFHEGQFLEKIDSAIIPFLHGGKIIQFRFRDVAIKKQNKIGKKAEVYKIGCLLPPYISRIQQRFALFLHRQDLPRIPDGAYLDR